MGAVQASTRQERFLTMIDLATMQGVEIGPLANPIVPRTAGRILYADHASTEALRRKYAGHGWDTGSIVDVDLDLTSRPLSVALGEQRVDFVVASHVIEHVPDPVRWLQDLHAALRPGGIVSLAIPDKRFCFDAKRPESTPGELVDAYLSRRSAPTVKQTYDFWSYYCQVDAHAVWSGALDPQQLPRSGTLQNALEKSREAIQAAGYTDVHCWVFTPASFLEACAELAELGMLPFRILRFAPTLPGDLEFFVSLQRLEEEEAAGARVQRAAEIRALIQPVLAGPQPAAPRSPSAEAAPRAPHPEQPALGGRLPESARRLGRPLYRVLEQVCLL
jgi:SAM-dependent methyltransferase